jgi:hypothetical protein
VGGDAMDISAEVAAIQAASQGSELRQPLVGALNKLNSGSLPAVTVSDVGKILKVGANGWEVGEKSGYMPVPTATKQITENGTHDVTNYASAVVNVSGGGGVNILSGTDEPASNIGANGNIYLQYIINDLPSGYTRLQYIQSDGSQYINTGHVPTVNTSVKIKLNPQMISESGIFGSKWDLNGFFMMFYQSKFRWHTANAVDSSGITLNNNYVIEASNTGYSVNGESYTNNPSTALGGNPISIFRPTSVGPYNPSGKFKLYYFEIYENDILVKNLIPARRNLDNVVGLYDIVNNVFLMNSGTGNFVSESSGIISAYCKVNSVWRDLIGTDIDDVNTGN